MLEFKRDVLKAREIAYENFTQCKNEANQFWYGVLRLIITLSSSFLVLSIALVEKLFPLINNSNSLPGFLIMSWILLFISLIFGIIAELEASVFHGNLARAQGRAMHEMNKKIAQGIEEDTVNVEDDVNYLVPGKIIWGAISINCFVFAILCMCLALVGRIISREICSTAFIFAIVFIGFINVYLIRKR